MLILLVFNLSEISSLRMYMYLDLQTTTYGTVALVKMELND